MTGRLVWVPEGAKVVTQRNMASEDATYYVVVNPIPLPTAADIDALVTDAAARAAQMSLIASGVAKWVERDDAAMAIKAALRELLIMKEPETKPRLDNDYCDVPGMRGRGNW